jgi:hypothetical protein
MWPAHVGNGNREPDRIVPMTGKASEDDIQSARGEGPDVLHDDELGSNVADDAGEL